MLENKNGEVDSQSVWFVVSLFLFSTQKQNLASVLRRSVRLRDLIYVVVTELLPVYFVIPLSQ